eukprot:GHVU01197630.1.p1 GENE.GHVU01197630.1~~GHVU01197630.1.p1  ORF type:complete len:163 (-),score=20.07 GHVU01197630.1:453-941(-)
MKRGRGGEEGGGEVEREGEGETSGGDCGKHAILQRRMSVLLHHPNGHRNTYHLCLPVVYIKNEDAPLLLSDARAHLILGHDPFISISICHFLHFLPFLIFAHVPFLRARRSLTPAQQCGGGGGAAQSRFTTNEELVAAAFVCHVALRAPPKPKPTPTRKVRE